MKKISYKFIKNYIFTIISRIKCLDTFLLKLNDINNNLLKFSLKQSFETRIPLYGEGSIRLYNDPDINVFYRWSQNGHITWAEQSTFNIQALLMFEHRSVLELCCGNGWYYRNFYSKLNNISYIGCDLSEEAISEANKKTIKCNSDVSFFVADICTDMALMNDSLTNVFWFSSMCMFTKEQRRKILLDISKKLKEKNGILSGSCEIKSFNEEQWIYYIGLFEDENELRSELGQFFYNIFITKISDKKTLYFMASDGNLPFYNR